MKRHLATAALLFASTACFGSKPADVVCSYAPSQSKAASVLAGAAGGAAGAVGAVAAATGTTAVVHSSGALILTGSGGYIAGTLGTAIVGPTIVVVGLVLGGAAVSVELLCAPKNHPQGIQAVKNAATEFAKRTAGAFANVRIKVVTRISGATLKVKEIAGDAAAYAFRRTSE